nr:MAG TPA: 30S ribosomal protein S27 [Caudoviricetes sp.]
MSEKHEYVASKSEYNIINGRKIYKVREPFYKEKEQLIYATCPYCGGQVNRVWNLNNCGNCGAEISWADISVAGYHDIQ